MKSIITLFTTTLFVFAPMSAIASQPIKCAQLFLDSHIETKKADYVGVSLTYSPALIIDNKQQNFDYKVLVESYLPNQRRPVQQILRPFFDPITQLLEPYGKSYVHNPGLKAIYDNYGNRVDAEIIKKVITVEEKLPLPRQSTFFAKNVKTDQAYGFIRVFDGSIYNNGIRAQTDYLLPLEKILGSMNKSTTIVNEKRRQGADVFEIGKYFIQDHLDPVDAKSVKSDILHWLVGFLESRGSDELKKSYFFAHVASQTHQIAYRRFFGFEVVDKNLSQDLSPDESILMIKGDQLLKNLQQTLNR